MKDINLTGPLVSIIVVTYNSSAYVLDTLQSAYEQTYKNIELIVTDDCSKDNTLELVNQWADTRKNRFRRFEIVPGVQNQGIPSNCNKGLKAARGEWIKIIAGDDILMDNCISDFLEFALANNSSFIFSDIKWFINDKEEILHDISEDRYRNALAKLKNKEQIIFYSRYPVFINSPAWFFSKKKIDFFFNEDFKYLEDQPFIFQLLNSGHRIYYMKKYTVWYRRHDKSVVISNSSVFYNEFSVCFKRYRKPNLKKKSLMDMLYVINYHSFMAEHRTKKNLFFKVIFYPFRKMNSLIFRFVNPQAGLKAIIAN